MTCMCGVDQAGLAWRFYRDWEILVVIIDRQVSFQSACVITHAHSVVQ